MEVKKDGFGMLDLMIRPGFCVKGNQIIKVNPAAESLLLTIGTDVRSLLLTGQEEYEAFDGGCLYLKLKLTTQGCGATVTRMDDCDVFILDQESDDSALRCLALAARELREPLTSIMISAERILPQTSPDASEQAARLNRGLHQLLRIIGNMSDASHCGAVSHRELRDISALFDEIFEKAQNLIRHTGLTLRYEGLSNELLCLVDGEQLERSVLNMLSNAVKFTPKGGFIDARLTRRNRMLQLSITDSGSGIAESMLGTVFNRYLRQPGIEDSRFGMGLGMVLIRSAASNHGGTVLIDQPDGKGTRITMTMAIRQNPDGMLRSPVMRIDYAGERDHGLIELSDCLPIHVYEKE